MLRHNRKSTPARIDVLGNALCLPRRCLLTSYQMSRDVHTLTDPGQMAGVGILNHQKSAVECCLALSTTHTTGSVSVGAPSLVARPATS